MILVKNYEVCCRLEPRRRLPSTFLRKVLYEVLEKVFPKHDRGVKCFVIRTNKTKEEIVRHYGGPRYVNGVTENTLTTKIIKKINQEVPII